MKIAITRKLPGTATASLNEVFDEVVELEKNRPLNEAELEKLFKGADVGICMLTDKIRAETVSGLKCLITYSVGLDHIVLNEVMGAGVRVAHTPSVLTEATADLTWALILASARRIVEASDYMRDGRFNGFGPELFLGRALYGEQIGVVGMGRIGSAVARRAHGFGMKIVYASRSRKREAEAAWGAKRLELPELLASSDVVTLHCPLNEQTSGLIGSKELEAMKPDAVLVNTARGAIIDEASLVAHLQSHSTFRAGLDVFEGEPSVVPGLLDCQNVVCAPHIGSANVPTRERMSEICVEEAIRFAKGESLRYEVRR